MSMPKIGIYKDNRLFSPKNNIWLAKDRFDMFRKTNFSSL